MAKSSLFPNRRRALLLHAAQTLRFHPRDCPPALHAWLRLLQVPGGLRAIVEQHPAVFAVSAHALPRCSQPMLVDEMEVCVADVL
jgi:hypothetical protein